LFGGFQQLRAVAEKIGQPFPRSFAPQPIPKHLHLAACQRFGIGDPVVAAERVDDVFLHPLVEGSSGLADVGEAIAVADFDSPKIDAARFAVLAVGEDVLGFRIHRVRTIKSDGHDFGIGLAGASVWHGD